MRQVSQHDYLFLGKSSRLTDTTSTTSVSGVSKIAAAALLALRNDQALHKVTRTSALYE